MTAHRETTAQHGHLRTLWAAAHAPVPGVPRWARVAALAIPVTVLPSGLWRIAAVTFDVPLGLGGEQTAGDLPWWLPLDVYVVLLSIVSELAAFMAIGLIAGWGEVFPRWIPGLGGRRVPTLAAVLPATAGAVFLTCLWTPAVVLVSSGRKINGDPLSADFPMSFHDWEGLLFFASYAPLVLWGPLLAAVTVAYHRRRTGRGAGDPRDAEAGLA